MDFIVKVENLEKSFGNEKVLDGVCLNIKKGETIAVLGVSGTGKTTLLRIIAGLETADKGRVFINGKLATDGKNVLLPPHKRKIGFIFQNLGLWEHMTVYQHLEFIKKDKEKIENILKKFVLWQHRDKKPYQLSGGQKQRLAIARVFIQEPEILLLDEPFSNLDMIRKKQLRKEILKIKQEKNLTVIYVTHDPIDVKILSDRAAVLHNGKVIQTGSYEELLSNPKETVVKELLEI